MVMNLGFMGRMFVIMRPMLASMFMVVYIEIPAVCVLVNVLVNMFMGVGV